jgi:hypothetical protein
MIGRILSLLLTTLYVVSAYWTGGGETGANVFLFCLLPLACILFPDAMGGYTGTNWGGMRPSITAESPGCLVKLLGWAMLLFPILVWLILKFGV